MTLLDGKKHSNFPSWSIGKCLVFEWVIKNCKGKKNFWDFVNVYVATDNKLAERSGIFTMFERTNEHPAKMRSKSLFLEYFPWKPTRQRKCSIERIHYGPVWAKKWTFNQKASFSKQVFGTFSFKITSLRTRKPNSGISWRIFSYFLGYPKFELLNSLKISKKKHIL